MFVREHRRPPAFHTLRPGSSPNGAGALCDQTTLEIHDAGQYGQHRSSVRRCRIGPRLGQRTQAGSGLLDPHRDRQNVGPGSGKPIKARHRHHVARAQVVKHARQLGPRGLRLGSIFLKNVSDAGDRRLDAESRPQLSEEEVPLQSVQPNMAGSSGDACALSHLPGASRTLVPASVGAPRGGSPRRSRTRRIGCGVLEMCEGPKRVNRAIGPMLR